MLTDLMKLSNKLFDLSRECPKEYESVLMEASLALIEINAATEGTPCLEI